MLARSEASSRQRRRTTGRRRRKSSCRSLKKEDRHGGKGRLFCWCRGSFSQYTSRPAAPTLRHLLARTSPLYKRHECKLSAPNYPPSRRSAGEGRWAGRDLLLRRTRRRIRPPRQGRRRRLLLLLPHPATFFHCKAPQSTKETRTGTEEKNGGKVADPGPYGRGGRGRRGGKRRE